MSSRMSVAEPTQASKALQLLRCQQCSQYMRPPFHGCLNNHMVCSECYNSNQRACWKCKQRYTDVRNKALEDLAVSIRYPCKHKSEGCEETLSLEEINAHEKHCVHRIYNCLLSKKTDCTWRGKLSWVHYHMNIMHRPCLVVFQDPNVPSISWQITKGGCFTDFTHVIFAFGEVFLYHKKFDYDEKKLCLAVQYIGPRVNALQFKYKLKYVRDDGKQVLSMSHVVHHEDENMDMTFSRGDCVVMYYDMLTLMTRSVNSFKVSKLKN